jgi:hypothetical protein
MAEYKIIEEYGHYVVYCDGVFLCTADTYEEAMQEIATEKKGLE